MRKDRRGLGNRWGGSYGGRLIWRSSGALCVALCGRRDATSLDFVLRSLSHILCINVACIKLPLSPFTWTEGV